MTLITPQQYFNNKSSDEITEDSTLPNSNLIDPSKFLSTSLPQKIAGGTLLDPSEFLGITTTPTEEETDTKLFSTEDTTSYYPDGYENSWGNRFAIATDRMQESLYKGVDLIADITGAEDLKSYAQEGIQRNIKQAAEKPQPTRTSSFTEGSKEIGQEFREGDVLGAIGRGLLLFKDMSAEVLPSMAPVLGGAVVGGIAAAPIAGAGAVGAASATAIRVLAPFIPGFLMGSGETYDEAKRLGVKEKDAQGWAVAGGATIGILDKLGAMGILKGVIKSNGRAAVEKALKDGAGATIPKKQITKIVDDVIKPNAEKDLVNKHLLLEAGKKGKNFVKNVTKRGLQAGGLEAVTEGAQGLTQIAAAQAGGITGENKIDFYTAPEVIKRVEDDAALGFVGGKTTGLAVGAIGELQSRDANIEIENENKAYEELSENLPKNRKQLLSEVKKRQKEAAPSIAGKVLRTAMSPLFNLSTKSEAGYNIYNALNTYYDQVSKDVGGFSERVEAAFNLVRKDIKSPFAKSISKLNNDQLFNVLYYGQKTKDKNIQEAATIIRRDILGEKLADEVSITKDSFMKQLKEGRSVLEETEKANSQIENLTPSEITTLNNKVKKVNSSFEVLKQAYNNKVQQLRKKFTTGALPLNKKDKYVIIATNKDDKTGRTKGRQEIVEELNLEATVTSAKGKSSYKTPQEAFAEMNKTKKSVMYKERGTDIYGRTLDVYKYQGNAKNAKFTDKNKINEEFLKGKLDSKKFNQAISNLDKYFLFKGRNGINARGKDKKIKDAFKEISHNKSKKGEGFINKKGTLIQPVKATALFGTLADSGVTFDFRNDYFPRVFKFNSPFAWKRARKILMQSEVVDGKTGKKRKRTEEEANALIDNIRGNDNVQSKKAEGLELEEKKKNDRVGPESQASFENTRRIDDETFKLLDEAGLVERNVKKIVDRYILQASQRDNIAKIKKVIELNVPELTKNNQLKDYEAKRIKDIYDAIQNRYKPISNSGLNKLVRMMGTYQYMLTLPLAALTALSEPFIVLSRVGPQHAIYGISRASANAFRQSLRSILPKLKKTESEMNFRSILQGFDGTLAERLGDIAGISVSRRITDAFFKFTLLTQVTQFSRDIALQAISSQMKKDTKLVAAKYIQRQNNPNLKTSLEEVRAKKRLRELGIVDVGVNFKKSIRKKGEPIKQFRERQRKEKAENIKALGESDIFRWASGEIEGTPPGLVRAALSKGVDDIIMAPNAINRPLWMSNPHLALVAQLKGFMFTFGSKVGMRLWREIITPLSQGRIPMDAALKYGVSLTLIIAVSLAIKELKDELRYGDEPSAFKKKQGWEHIRDALLTSNIFGPATPMYDMLRANQYGASPFGVAMGPTYQWVDNIIKALGDAVIRDKPRQAIRQGIKAIPFVSAIRPQLASEVADNLGY